MMFRRGKQISGLDDVTQTNPNALNALRFKKDFTFGTPAEVTSPPMPLWEKLGLGGLVLAILGAGFALATGKKKKRKK